MYEGVLNDSIKGIICVSGEGVDPNRVPTCEESCALCVMCVEEARACGIGLRKGEISCGV